jgi:endonuclease/exonuclease/phosphatase family metal-dependent hydrolase
MASIKVLTLNILNDLSRWEERKLLLVKGLQELGPDLIGLQEVTWPLDYSNAHWLADQLGGYTVTICPKTGASRDKEGLAILSRLPVEGRETLDLRTQNRAAQYIRIGVDGRPVVFVNGHYYWRPGETAERTKQIRFLLTWLQVLPPETAVIVCGDFNGTPDSEAIVLMRQHYASAYAVRHGREPEFTCPTPLSRPKGKLRDVALFLLNLAVNGTLQPWRGTLDYIFVNDQVRVLSCDVVLNCPAPHDPTLYPSDHFGLMATLEVV